MTPGTQIGFSACHRADGRLELLDARVLDDVARRSSLKRLAHVDRIGVHRQDDGARGQVLLATRSATSSPFISGRVMSSRIRSERVDATSETRIGTVIGFAHDLDVRQCLQQCPDAGAHQGVVFDQNNSECAHWVSAAFGSAEDSEPDRAPEATVILRRSRLSCRRLVPLADFLCKLWRSGPLGTVPRGGLRAVGCRRSSSARAPRRNCDRILARSRQRNPPPTRRAASSPPCSLVANRTRYKGGTRCARSRSSARCSWPQHQRRPRPRSVHIEDLTWFEIRDAMAAGRTTAILYAGRHRAERPAHVACQAQPDRAARGRADCRAARQRAGLSRDAVLARRRRHREDRAHALPGHRVAQLRRCSSASCGRSRRARSPPGSSRSI